MINNSFFLFLIPLIHGANWEFWRFQIGLIFIEHLVDVLSCILYLQNVKSTVSIPITEWRPKLNNQAIDLVWLNTLLHFRRVSLPLCFFVRLFDGLNLVFELMEGPARAYRQTLSALYCHMFAVWIDWITSIRLVGARWKGWV